MLARFWGVRGSIPVPGPSTVRYGGNTPCIEVQADGQRSIILDAGTGIRPLGKRLAADKVTEIHLMISHTHWDHIQGFNFFAPLFIPGTEIHIYGPTHHSKTVEQAIAGLLEFSYFPVSALQISAHLVHHDLRPGSFSIGTATVTTIYVNHPVFCLAYRIQIDGRSIVYTGDVEPLTGIPDSPRTACPETLEEIDAQTESLVEFIRGADLLAMDSTYLPEEFAAKRGWGHATWDLVLRIAEQAGVGRVALLHHEPNRTDDQLDEIGSDAAAAAPDGMQVIVAREGLELEV